MNTQKDRLNKRNIAVRNHFNKVTRDNPKWRIEAIIEDTANKFFLANRTIEAIVTNEGIYNN
ncbi:hypothetical protein [Flavobacterium sp.]|uniref:hypothetical protein n=1 Tax=Flavobacterium sp. TaxID=239 RepID=UPI0037531C77